MSTVYLHVGQCGVQIGKEFWKDAITKSTHDVDVKHTLFSLSNEPRCLFIDSEHKVIQKLIEETKKSKVFKNLNVAQNSIQSRKGCGSNWAMGYHGLKKHVIGDDLPRLNAGFGKFIVDHDSSMLEVCIEAIRTKVEKCDSFSGFLCLNSLAGGTGSGWGSRMCQELNDLYPTAYRLWNVVTPCDVGETPTQHYNQLLALAKLQEFSDAIVVFHNDRILDGLTKINSGISSSFSDVNKVISQTLQSLYFPISSLTSQVGGLSIGIEPWEMLRSLAVMPSNKFLQTSFSEMQFKESNQTVWDRLLKRGTTSINNYRSYQDRCVSALCVCRGSELNCFPNLEVVSPKLKTALHCVSWNPFPVDLWWDNPKKCVPTFSNRQSKSLALCINCSSIRDYLRKVCVKSQTMFNSGAYLHWYSQYEVFEEDFCEAFRTLKAVDEEYDNL